MSEIWNIKIASGLNTNTIYRFETPGVYDKPYIEYNKNGIKQLYILDELASLWDAEVIKVSSIKTMAIILPNSHTNRIDVYDERDRKVTFTGHIVPATNRTMGEVPELGGKFLPDIRWYYTAVHKATFTYNSTNRATEVRYPKLSTPVHGGYEAPLINNATPPTYFTFFMKEATKFFYLFGIDDIEIKNMKINKTCGFITRDVEIENDTKIELTTETYENNTSSIEFYIIDRNVEIPINPISQERIMNEKIFFGKETRFGVDESKEIIIKKDGIATNISFEEAKSISDGALYTISYYPEKQEPYLVKGDNIKIKAILRVYDEERKPPYIKSIGIKKYRLEGFEWQR